MLKHKQCSGKRLGKMYAYANFTQLSPKAWLGTGTILQETLINLYIIARDMKW